MSVRVVTIFWLVILLITANCSTPSSPSLSGNWKTNEVWRNGQWNRPTSEYDYQILGFSENGKGFNKTMGQNSIILY